MSETDKISQLVNPEQEIKTLLDYRAKIVGYRWDFWKFFLGPFILGAASAFCTWVYKDYELKIANRKAESTYLQPYLKQYLDLIEKDSLKFDKACSMAEFISYTVTDEDLKKGWSNLKTTLAKRLDSVRTGRKIAGIKRDSFQSIAKKIAIDLKNPTKTEHEKKTLIARQQSTFLQINQFNALSKQYEKHLTIPPETKPVDTNSSTKIEKPKENDGIVTQYSLLAADTLMCTTNKYVVFPKSSKMLRIYVKGINKSSKEIEVSFYDIENGKSPISINKTDIHTAKIIADQPYILEYNNYKYKINLIDFYTYRFKAAVDILVETYKKYSL